MPRLLRAFAASLALGAAAYGCSDLAAPTGGPLVQPTGGPVLEYYDPAIEVSVLQRATPLERDYTATATIGRAGGVIAIPEAGFRIDFPSNAVKGQPVTITVTALAGSNVAYVFQPHGLVFHNNPLITQDLRPTEVWQNHALRDELEGAYFPDPTYLGNGVAKVKETRPTVVDVAGWKMKFNVHHFSGYLAAAGRRGGYIAATGDRLVETGSFVEP